MILSLYNSFFIIYLDLLSWKTDIRADQIYQKFEIVVAAPHQHLVEGFELQLYYLGQYLTIQLEASIIIHLHFENLLRSLLKYTL